NKSEANTGFRWDSSIDDFSYFCTSSLKHNSTEPLWIYFESQNDDDYRVLSKELDDDGSSAKYTIKHAKVADETKPRLNELHLPTYPIAEFSLFNKTLPKIKVV